ncbi:MAG TPA: LPS assembly protein LptD [Nitrospirota bacterium]|nr:LPS assembly protein LptD [Nitrospirota bacterium]
MKRRTVFILGLLLAGLLAGPHPHALAETPPKKIPISVSADKLDYDRVTDVYTAVGHVKIEQEGVKLEADKVVFHNKTGEVEAEGKVYLQDVGNVVHADSLKINLNTREGVLYKGDLFMQKDNYHLRGDVIERRSENVYHVENGMFTTCDESDWYIKADEMNIDLDRYATGKSVSLKLAGVPMLYTPYLLFPVRRQSGLLIPVIGYSSRDGIFAENAFFWAMSDYRDMTIYSDYRARTGHGTGLEYRYNNSKDSAGQAYTKVWDLYHTGDTRWDLRLRHQEEFAEDLSARADINLVSDFRYYHELERSLEMSSKPYVDSNAFYVERWNTSSIYLLGQYSTDLTKTNENTVQKLPELRYTIFEETLAGPVHLNFDGSATNFYRQSGDGARRVDLNPQLSAVFGSGGLSITPRAGARATFYDRSATSVEPTERKFFYTGADMNVRVSRVYGSDSGAGIGRVRHSIEPTISYNYIPHIDQGSIPVFDAVDTVAAQNLTTFAVINRLTAHYRASKDSPAYSTFDIMVFRLSQSYDLNVKEEVPGGARRRSDILAELALRSPRALSLAATVSYNTYLRLVSSRSISTTYTADRFTMSLSDNYVQNPAAHFVIGGSTVKLGRWSLGGQWTRDVQNDKTQQEDYSLYYASQCWGVRGTYTAKPGEYRYMVMLDLKGIGSRGSGR